MDEGPLGGIPLPEQYFLAAQGRPGDADWGWLGLGVVCKHGELRGIVRWRVHEQSAVPALLAEAVKPVVHMLRAMVPITLFSCLDYRTLVGQGMCSVVWGFAWQTAVPPIAVAEKCRGKTAHPLRPGCQWDGWTRGQS